jgi:hypothetical protein
MKVGDEIRMFWSGIKYRLIGIEQTTNIKTKETLYKFASVDDGAYAFTITKKEYEHYIGAGKAVEIITLTPT